MLIPAILEYLTSIGVEYKSSPTTVQVSNDFTDAFRIREISEGEGEYEIFLSEAEDRLVCELEEGDELEWQGVKNSDEETVLALLDLFFCSKINRMLKFNAVVMEAGGDINWV